MSALSDNTFLKELRARATKGGLRKILLPEATDERVREAAQVLKKEQLAENRIQIVTQSLADDTL